MESHLVNLERFLKKHFPRSEEGKVKLKKLFVSISWNRCSSDPREAFGPPVFKLPDWHPLSRWADGIEGLRNTRDLAFNRH